MNKIKIIKFSVLLVFLCSLQALNAQQKVADNAYQLMLETLLSHDVPEKTVVDLKQSEDSIYLLDAREKREYEVSHLKNAIWTGYDSFKMSRIKAVPKDAQIVVYCSVGYRSEVITRKLLKKGYTNVSNLYGGIFEWVNAGGQVVSQQDTATKEVHAYDKTWGVWLRKGKKVYK